jgi:NADH dehydrogenase FAD-containing subunit
VADTAIANPGTPATVVVVGGGYAGVNAARALDEHAQVTLVEPKDAFQHNVAALRALVDPGWPQRIFLPYHNLLSHGTVLRDTATQVDAGTVRLASGTLLRPDFVVLATGSGYPFPAKTDRPDTAGSVARYRAAHAHLAGAGRVLLLGAGAVGLELAGEIATAWPDKQITVVDPADDILPGPYDPRLRAELHRQLDDLGVTRILGSPLTTPPRTPAGEPGAFTVTTLAGDRVEADLWLRCHGTAPRTGYLTGDLAAARRSDGCLHVTPDLRVAGAEKVYAVGDIADIDIDRASAAREQALVAAADIRARITGSPDRPAYRPGPPMIILPLGPHGGAGQVPGHDGILDAATVSQLKGHDLLMDRYVQLLDATTAPAR